MEYIPMLAFQGQLSGDEAALIAGLIMFIVITLAISFAILIVICALLHSALARVPREHRTMEPGLVWLLLIPLFSLIWNFFVFLRIPESYKNYFTAQGRTDVGDCGRGVGLGYAICGALAIVPCVNYLAAPVAVVLLIIFLVKVFGLKGQISAARGEMV